MLNIEKINTLLATRQTASVTEANQNFSKIARIADQEKAVVLLRNNRPKYILIDLEQINEKTETLSPEEFMDSFQQNGIWVLHDANAGVKTYIRNHYPEKYEDEMEKVQTIEKLLKVDDDLIIISIANSEWAGVYKIALSDVQIDKDSEGILTLSYNPDKREEIVSVTDYEKPVEKSVQLLSGKRVLALTTEPDLQHFNRTIIETGYITAEEIQKYSNPAVKRQLPYVRTIQTGGE